MIIYLYGPDSYRRQKKLKEIINKYKTKHSGLTIEYFNISNGIDGGEELARLKNFITYQSLFGASKLGIVSNPLINQDFKKILELVLNDKRINLILITDEKLGPEFDFLLQKPVLSQSFDELSPAQMAFFIKKEAAERNLKLTPQIVNSLIRTNNSDSWAVINELDKLALGGIPDRLESLPNFFVLLNKLKSCKSVGQKIAALSWLLENEEPAAIFNILASQADFDLKRKMADYDAVIKSGKLNYEEALLDLVI